MKSIRPFFFCLLLVYPSLAKDEAKLPRQIVEALVEASCIDCHDADTKTALNFNELSFDLTDADAFRMWEKVHDMVDSGEMPPEKKPRPDPNLKSPALKSLHQHLHHLLVSMACCGPCLTWYCSPLCGSFLHQTVIHGELSLDGEQYAQLLRLLITIYCKTAFKHDSNDVSAPLDPNIRLKFQTLTRRNMEIRIYFVWWCMVYIYI